jgi:hypothetical protein
MSELMQSETSAWRRIVIQTMALIVDAYREVNSKKLFWLTVIFSLLIAAVFAFVGINERGITLFTAEFPGPWNTNILPRDQFYKTIFTAIAIPWWLGVFATVLALISVCSIFPDLLTGGSIDLYLAKPVSRLRLFLTKYLLGLTFAALQVTVFTLACFLVMGIRGGSWEWRTFIAIPLVTLFFSYLFCMCVFVGILTRSSIASLLLTVLFWGLLFGLNTTDGALLSIRSWFEERLDNQQRLVEYNADLLTRNEAMPTTQKSNLSEIERQQGLAIQKLAEVQATTDRLKWWHTLFVRIKTPFPKTSETVELMNRWLVPPETTIAVSRENARLHEERRARRGRPRDPDHVEPNDPAVLERTQQAIASRTAVKIIGSSLGFEAVVLGLAALVFCRRDF